MRLSAFYCLLEFISEKRLQKIYYYSFVTLRSFDTLTKGSDLQHEQAGYICNRYYF